MTNIFNIPTNYNGSDLFNSLDEVYDFVSRHEEELEGLRLFNICFDTDYWSETLSSKGLELNEALVNDMHNEYCGYFEDVKEQHGTAALVYYHNDERINLFSISY